MLPYLTPNDQNDGPTEESTDSSNADTSHADTARADTSHADSSHAAFLSAWLNGDSLSFSKSLALNEVVSVGTSMIDGHHYYPLLKRLFHTRLIRQGELGAEI